MTFSTNAVRALLAGASVFLLGAVAGVLLDRSVLLPDHSGVLSTGAARRHEEVLAELRAELGLSPEQAGRVQEILAARHGEIEQTWRILRAKVESAVQGATTEIEAVLDSSQIERFHLWLAARHGQPTRGCRGGGTDLECQGARRRP